MKKTNLQIIDWLLSSRRFPASTTNTGFNSFRQAFFTESESWETPADRAVAGGFSADCAAFAFAAGYCTALQRLIPGLPANTIACFCITEEGGGHPRAIKSRLVPVGNDGDRKTGFVLNGRKKYVTCATEADLFLVAASMGTTAEGRNCIRMVSIDSQTPGITIVPMKDLRLVPEISHGELIFTDVAVSEADLLPGDGYTDYIRPFRTIEDLHVTAAILGYLFRNACIHDWDRDIKASILGRIVSVRSLALASPTAPAVHIAADDVLKQVKMLIRQIEPCWDKMGGAAKSAWDRDKLLMNIADTARTRRLQTAWEFYEGKPAHSPAP